MKKKLYVLIEHTWESDSPTLLEPVSWDWRVARNRMKEQPLFDKRYYENNSDVVAVFNAEGKKLISFREYEGE